MGRSAGRYPPADHQSRPYRAANAAPSKAWWRDVIDGAMLGDFAQALGLPGTITQVALSFIPVVGTLGAVRDTIANWRQRDWVNVLLNMLVLVPFLGGFAKVVEVIRHTRRVGRALRTAREREQADQAASRGRRAR